MNLSLRGAALAAAAILVLSLFPASLTAQKKTKSTPPPVPAATENPNNVDLEFISRLRDEEFNHGQVMEIMSDLTDNIGPRLTGSPNMKKANEWTRDELTKFGLVNSHLESWGPFGRGWAYQMCEVRMVSPDFMQFLALPEAWTPGTNGPIRGQVVQVIAKTPADLDKYKGQLAGKIVLLGEARVPEPSEKPLFRRYDEAELAKIAGYEVSSPFEARLKEYMERYQFQQKLAAFLAEEHPAAVLDITREPGSDGTIFVQSGGSYEKDKPVPPPRVTVSVEHFGRVARLLAKKVPVEIEVNVQAQFYDDDPMGYDTIAEIPGTDPSLKEQVVMLGGHLDSWHAGEGATDNGAGTAVAMEAVRLLKKLGVQPRRTIRIGLWSGEEEGLLGSRGYVKEHFGSRPICDTDKCKEMPAFFRPPAGPLQLKPEQKQVSVYFNLDNGTGKIRGVYMQGNAAAAPIFKTWMEPFRDLGMTTLTMRNTGGTDHLSFDAVGIPGFQFIQDPMDYDTLTHHSNLDVYEHVRPDDMKQASIIMASFVYNAAMRDEMFPRKPIRPDEPKPPAQESESGAEKKGEVGPPPANPLNPSQPMPSSNQQQQPPKSQ